MTKVEAVKTEKQEGPRRSNRLSVKKRKYVVDKMKEEVEQERKRAVRGSKKMVNRLTSEYRRKIFEALRKKEFDAEEAVKVIVGIRETFKKGIKALDSERESQSTVPLSPKKEASDEPMSEEPTPLEV